jgi:ribosome-associated translation inhibitor RaiA
MQSPVQIDFQGMKPREALRAVIAEHVAGLEDRFGRITPCRVVVKAPSERHRTGGLYEIHIRLALPDGKEVDIGRTPRLDERRADVHFALNDAFNRARRQLQDQVRRMQGHVKMHQARP